MMRENIPELIKSQVTMPAVLARYGYEPKKRMRCPLHGGDDLNFAIDEKRFMCFSRCGGGDVITFVQKLFGLSFHDTLKKMDADFGLNLYGYKPFDEQRGIYYRGMALKARTERFKAIRERAESEYWKAFDEWKRLSDNKEKYKPKTDGEELHPLFVEALQKLSVQEYALECAEMELRKYE